MTKAGNMNLIWDKNGRLVAKQTIPFEYNRDGRLRSAAIEGHPVSIKYDPAGNRIQKNSYVNGNHKYIVDAVSDVPKVLLVLDANNNNAILKTFIHTDSEVLMQHNGDYNADKYFYLHDRLGSVRLLIGDTGSVVNSYTYDPFGKAFDSETYENVSVSNPYRFANYFWDDDMGLYYCINRYYDPVLMRWTARDPADGKFEEPMTLHVYLYCLNDPINFVDPRGLWTIHVMLSGMLSAGVSYMYQTGIVLDDKGNIGWITTSSSPHPVEGLDHDWGGGLGTTAASAGIAVGWTSADTIFDLAGAGISVGGSVPLWGPVGVGVDYLQGVQRNGEYYYGFEIVPDIGWAPWGGVEAHGHKTWTTINPWRQNQQKGLAIVEESIEDSVYEAQTLGEADILLSIFAYTQ
jgi:RHS repeat-associated protein